MRHFHLMYPSSSLRHHVAHRVHGVVIRVVTRVVAMVLCTMLHGVVREVGVIMVDCGSLHLCRMRRKPAHQRVSEEEYIA
jgi:hypothetical protein